ncbi:MAG: cysteine--tRNA ligase [Thermaerobacter sp.]|nr:cysteine--tRNA ligase [Thermaerobacter sp.]
MRLYNTLTQSKQPFVPLEPGVVRMYVCGPTVYHHLHVGNFRSFVIFDTLARFFEGQGFRVLRVQNFTDIDDKMIARAKELNVSVPELAERYIAQYAEDAQALAIEEPYAAPRPTEHIEEIVSHIGDLVAKGLAYPLEGDVYFRVSAFPGYGKLSHQTSEERLAGARVEVDERKEEPADFVLWKGSRPGEPNWPSPWGPGRPGWHIECSAMARCYLGDTLDIHAGGQDLIFPHHENEIAQSEGLLGHPFARYWLHAAMLTMDGAKMSKSQGNIVPLSDLRVRYRPQAIRLFLLSAHYRTPLAFREELIEGSEAALTRIENCLTRLGHLLPHAAPDDKGDQSYLEHLEHAERAFDEALSDDLNTAQAQAVLFNVVREANTLLDVDSAQSVIRQADSFLRRSLATLGITLAEDAVELGDEVERLIAEREQARRSRDFQTADRIRDDLRAKGIVLEDTPQGVRWHRG